VAGGSYSRPRFRRDSSSDKVTASSPNHRRSTLVKRKQGATDAYIWEGASRTDGSTPKLWVMIGKMRPSKEQQSLDCAVLLAAGKQKLRLQQPHVFAPAMSLSSLVHSVRGRYHHCTGDAVLDSMAR
jgi:hypothetical protein